jgi:type IV pilus assembly protein PilO
MSYQLLLDMLRARGKSFAFLAFLAVVNLLLFLYLSLWQEPALAKAQNDWFAMRKAQASGKNLASATLYANGVRDFGVFQQRLIPKKAFPGFLAGMFDAAKGNSLTLKGVSYKASSVKEQPGVVYYEIGLTVSGKYAAVKSFIGDLSRYPEMVTLDSLMLVNSSKTEESVEMKLLMTAYLKTEGA